MMTERIKNKKKSERLQKLKNIKRVNLQLIFFAHLTRKERCPKNMTRDAAWNKTH